MALRPDFAVGLPLSEMPVGESEAEKSGIQRIGHKP